MQKFPKKSKKNQKIWCLYRDRILIQKSKNSNNPNPIVFQKIKKKSKKNPKNLKYKKIVRQL